MVAQRVDQPYYFNQRSQVTLTATTSTAGKTKMIGTPGNKVAVAAKRPTFQAAPSLPITTRLAAMGPRASTRGRTVMEMLRQIRDYNPDASKALENYITLANPGYDLKVYFAKKKNETGEPQPDEEGLRLVQQIASRMFSEYSGAWDELAGEGQSDFPGVDSAINMIHLMVFTYGAAAMEVELTEALDDVVDFYPVDPVLIDFQLDQQTLRLQPGLMLQGNFTRLDPIRFRYIGKDPDVNQPGGRSPTLPLLDVIMFQQQFMRELQAITHMVNMPRLDVKVLYDMADQMLQATRPDLLQAGQEENRRLFLKGFIDDLTAEINNLEADDAFIHFDSVEVDYKSPGGTAIPVRDVMNAIDRMIVSGVKQLPILLGRNEGATTTHATVQWQVFVRQLGGYQRISRGLITWAFNLYLRILGRQSYAVLDYKQHQTSNELIDVQTLNAKAQAWAFIADRGWATQDQASMEVTGHPAEGTPVAATVVPDATVAADAAAVNKEENKAQPLAGADWRSLIELSSADMRAISEKVAHYPAWLQRVHHDTAHAYAHWRASAVLPKYTQALHEVYRSGTTLETMSETEVRNWLHTRLKLPEGDQTLLGNNLTTAARGAAKAAIEEQLRAVGKPQAVTVTNERLLKDLGTRARDGGWSIVETYNAELLAAIQRELVLEERGLGDIAGKVRDAIGVLISWESARNAWKQAQVALSETQDAVMRAIREFFGRNEVAGEAEVYPYDSTADICADYIAANPYPDMPTALAETVLPAHVDCPHYVRLVSGGTIEGDVWAGGE